MKSISRFVWAAGLQILLATAANATCPTFHTLTNGTTADADQVMDNFNHILGCPYFTGNVGIGTASPDSKLVVGALPTGGYYPPSIAAFYAAGDTEGVAWFARGGVTNPYLVELGVNQATGYGEIQAAQAGVGYKSLILNRQGGDVGIGTTSPDKMLSVNGDADKASGGTSWSVFSDLRLKDLDGAYTRDLTDIAKLEPIQFHYKKNNPLHLPSNTAEVGLVAQDVQKVFPEAITTGKGGYLEFNMSPVQFAMINAIKQLKTKNGSQAVEISALRTRLDREDRRLSALEAKLRIQTAQR